jgi:hypothetical protein
MQLPIAAVLQYPVSPVSFTGHSFYSLPPHAIDVFYMVFLRCPLQALPIHTSCLSNGQRFHCINSPATSFPLM